MIDNDPYTFLDEPAPPGRPPFNVHALAQHASGQVEVYLEYSRPKEAEEPLHDTLVFASVLAGREKMEIIAWAAAQGLKIARVYLGKGELADAGRWVQNVRHIARRLPESNRREALERCIAIGGDIAVQRLRAIAPAP